MKTLALEIRELAGKEDDFVTANEFEDHIAEYTNTFGFQPNVGLNIIHNQRKKSEQCFETFARFSLLIIIRHKNSLLSIYIYPGTFFVKNELVFIT